MIIYHDTTSLAEMLQFASADHDGEFDPGSWAEYLDDNQDGHPITDAIYFRAWHNAYCRWFDHNEAGHHRRAALWGAAADTVIRQWDKKKVTA